MIEAGAIPWRVLRVKTGREFECADYIQNLGFETYCPRVISTSRPRFLRISARQPAVQAMYRGWIMSKILPDARLDRLRSRGYLQEVYFSTAVSEAVIQFVRVTELEVATMTATKVKFKPGDFGSIMVGVLKGEPVEVLQVRKQKLLVRLTKFATRSAPILVAADSVQVTA